MTLRASFQTERERPLLAWISSRYTLRHTFAHLLIKRRTDEAGYSSASLRERLYVSTDRQAPLAGVLIYSAREQNTAG